MRDQKGMPIAYDEVRHGYYYTAATSEFPPLQLYRGNWSRCSLPESRFDPSGEPNWNARYRRAYRRLRRPARKAFHSAGKIWMKPFPSKQPER